MIDPDDERTALSRRRTPEPEQDDAPDDRTLPSRRSSGRLGEHDDTVVSARSSVPSDSEVPTQAATEPAPPGPRRTAHPPAPDDVAARSDGGRAASVRPVDAALAAEPAGRRAAVPGSGTASYRARPVPPAVVSRAGTARRGPQDYVDTAAADAAHRRRRRRRAVTVVAAASVLIVVAALALTVLLTIA
ncbi:hypothetical protein [Microbacterium sp. NPDC056569]|uniref:hypothetical protein n=1 Tax=Microbacterium sp. NPDC056569 TaxID=3345867 RepID=UPI00366D826C